jgi:hypothetical protein
MDALAVPAFCGLPAAACNQQVSNGERKATGGGEAKFQKSCRHRRATRVANSVAS